MADRSQGSEAVDTRRYLAAIRRDLPLIASLAIGLAVFAFALSLVLPKTYSASARVGFDLAQTGTQDSAAQERNIVTQQELVLQPMVLDEAIVLLGQDGIKTDAPQLRASITTQPVFGANLLDVRGSSDDPKLAAAYANRVAAAYVAHSDAAAEAILDDQIRALDQQIRASTDPVVTNQYVVERSALKTQKRTRSSQVVVAIPAEVPGGPDSPKPVRNGVLAFFVGLFLGVLIALLRDQLRPRFTTGRDLSQFLETPIVASIPELGRRLGVRAAPQTMRMEQEAYQSLSAALRLAMPPSKQHVLMLTSSMHAEGKTTVATRVARLLSGSGHRTLLISADLRWPRLDALLNVDGRRGLSDLLAAQQSAGVTPEQVAATIVSGDARDRNSGGADVLPSGTLSSDAARLLSSGALEPLFETIRSLDYTYVIVDTTPLLGLADARLIARVCDTVVAVSRLERISVPAALDFRDELARIGVPVLGLVVIGGNVEASPYYSGVKFVPPAAGAQPQGTPRPQVRS